MLEKFRSRFPGICEKLEIWEEEISIFIWKTFHHKEFLEKYKNSKLVNPDPIRIEIDEDGNRHFIK